MEYLKKTSILILTTLLIFYIGISITNKTHSSENFSIIFDEQLNVEKNNKYIKNINMQTKVSSLLNNITVTGTKISINVYNSSGQIKPSNDLISTGDVLKIYLNKTLQEEYAISINGDSSGDGIVDLIDLVQMRKHIVGWYDQNTNKGQKKEGIYYESLNLNDDELVDLIDLVRMRKMIVGKNLDELAEIYTATFNNNGANKIGISSIKCSPSNNKTSCEITTPTITDNKEIIGWSINKNSKTADVLTNKRIKITSDVTYYAITKDTYTATFDNANLDYLESKSLSCDIYNTEKSCDIILPTFNKLGHFNNFWSEYKAASSDLTNNAWNKSYFNQVGHKYTLTRDITLYPNFNHIHYSTPDKNQYKYRSINIDNNKTIGKTLFEFEKGIPNEIKNTFITEMNQAYNKLPWIFNSGKVFIMTEDTYSNYSIAYGLTHQMYISYGGDSHSIIDVQYDTAEQTISVNATLHELAHAWDSYYYFKTGESRISSLDDFDTFYNSIKEKLYVDEEDKIISKTETFAGMFTNYYWHVLKIDDTKKYYALKDNETLNEEELNNLKTFIEKYINIAKKGY